MLVLRKEGPRQEGAHKSQEAAYGTTCSKCGKEHHTSKVCRGERRIEPTQADTIHVSNLCNLSCTPNDALDHYIYDGATGHWVQRKSKPQPYVSLFAEVNKDTWGANWPPDQKPYQSRPWPIQAARVASQAPLP